MSVGNPMGDFELNANADGELDAEAAEAFRLAVAGDENMRASAALQETLRSKLHQAYDGVLSEPIAPRTAKLLRPVAGLGLPASLRPLAAALVIAVLGGGTGYVAGLERMGTDDTASIGRLALGAHQVYAAEIQHPVEMDGANGDHLAKWLGKRLGLEFTAPDIEATGFKLVGGRLLAEGDKPAALLLYENGSGRRISLFIEKWEPAGETSMHYASNVGLGSYYWIDSPFACAVSGDLSSDELRGVAQHIYTALSKT